MGGLELKAKAFSCNYQRDTCVKLPIRNKKLKREFNGWKQNEKSLFIKCAETLCGLKCEIEPQTKERIENRIKPGDNKIAIELPSA